MSRMKLQLRTLPIDSTTIKCSYRVLCYKERTPIQLQPGGHSPIAIEGLESHQTKVRPHLDDDALLVSETIEACPEEQHALVVEHVAIVKRPPGCDPNANGHGQLRPGRLQIVTERPFLLDVLGKESDLRGLLALHDEIKRSRRKVGIANPNNPLQATHEFLNTSDVRERLSRFNE